MASAIRSRHGTFWLATNDGTTDTFTVVAGSLPPGISLASNGTQGAILIGTPTQDGTFTFTVHVVNPKRQTAQETFAITVSEPPPLLLLCSPGDNGGIAQFNANYARTGSFWSAAPSNLTPFGLFSRSATYQRPATAYIALWQILGTDTFTKVLQQIQQTYGGGSITEPQLEAAFQKGLPNQSVACRSLLSQFFTEWFDTAYPSGSATRPDITGPGLAGPGFYGTHGGECKNV